MFSVLNQIENSNRKQILFVMKKSLCFFALATLLLLATRLHAQLGFHAGYAPQTMTVKSSVVSSSTNFHGFYAGIHYTFKIAGNFGITPAAQIRLNSANTKGLLVNTQDWQFAADVPLLLNYTFPLKNDFKIGVFAGPLMSFGISYRQKQTDPETFEVVNTYNVYDTKISELGRKRFEMNVAAGLSVHYKMFMIYGGYRFGLNDLDKMDSTTTKIRGFFVGIGLN